MTDDRDDPLGGVDELLDRLRADDDDARRELYDRHYDKLRRHFVRTLPNRDDAEDCASEVIVRALERIDAGARPLSLQLWLWGIARNVLMERYRDAERRGLRPVTDANMNLENASTTETEGGSVSYGQREALAAVRVVLPRLSATQREVMSAFLTQSLTAMEEVKGATLAAGMGAGWSATRVDRELHRAREAIRRGVGVLGVARAARGCPQALALVGAGDPSSTSLTKKQWATLAKHAPGCQACGPVFQDCQHSANWALGPGLLLLAGIGREDLRLTSDDAGAPDPRPARPTVKATHAQENHPRADSVPASGAPARPGPRARMLPLGTAAALILVLILGVIGISAHGAGRDKSPPESGAAPTGPAEVEPPQVPDAPQVPAEAPGGRPLLLPDMGASGAVPAPGGAAAAPGGGGPASGGGGGGVPGVPAGFTKLGSGLTTAPAAVSWATGRIDLFGVGANHALLHDSYDSRYGWLGWESLGGTLTSAPAVAAWGPGRLDVFGLGQDHSVWHDSYDSRYGWLGWESLGAPPGRTFVSAPAATSWGAGRLDVTVVTDDGFIASRYYDNGSWSGWGGTNGVAGATTVAAASWGYGRLDIMFLARDAELRSRYWDNNQWSALGAQSAASLAPHLDSNTRPALAAPVTGQLDIFALDTVGALRTRYFSRGQWTAWSDLGGAWRYGPAVSSQCGQLDIFVIGADGGIYHRAQATAPCGGHGG